MQGTPFTRREILRYADRLLDSAGVREGDVIALRLSSSAQLGAVQAVQDMAFRRGAMVEVIVNSFASREHVDSLLDRNAVFVSLDTSRVGAAEHPLEVEQDLLARAATLDFATAGRDHGERLQKVERLLSQSDDPWGRYQEKNAAGEVRWNVAMWPSRGWASEVYPDLAPDAAFRALGEDMLSFMRAAADEGQTAWQEHMQALQRRAETLSAMDIDHLEIEGEGTSIELGLAEGSRMLSCDMDTATGDRVCVNSPTEEVFGTPDPDSVSGTIKATKPLVIGAEVFEDVEVRFERGRIAEVSCSGADPADAEMRSRWLQQELFDPRRGMDRMGEVGLVDQSSRIAQSGRTYYNTILDENAGLHFGIGNSYSSFTGGEGNRAIPDPEYGLGAHIDLCCGSDSQRVVAVTRSGERIEVMDKGRWLI